MIDFDSQFAEDSFSAQGFSNVLRVQQLFHDIGLMADSSLWRVLRQDCDYEIWSPDFQFLGGCHRFFARTSYTLHDLLSSPWSELFERESEHWQKIHQAFGAALKSGKPQLDVTSFHEIRERRSFENRSLRMAVKAFYPLSKVEEPGVPAAILAITQVDSQLDFLLQAHDSASSVNFCQTCCPQECVAKWNLVDDIGTESENN